MRPLATVRSRRLPSALVKPNLRLIQEVYSFAGDHLTIVALPFLAGKNLTTKDTKYTKGEKSLDLRVFSFVTVVSFVFERSYPVKNGKTTIV